MLHSNFHVYTVFVSLTVNDLRIQSFFAFIQISYKFTDTAFVVEDLFSFHAFPVILQNDLQSFCKESHLPKPLFQYIVIINGFFKDLFIRQECDRSSMTVFFTVSCHLQRIHGLAPLVSLLINLTFMVNRYFQPF